MYKFAHNLLAILEGFVWVTRASCSALGDQAEKSFGLLGAAAWHLWRVPRVHHPALGRVAVSAAVLLGGAVAASRLPVALECLPSARHIEAKDLGIMF